MLRRLLERLLGLDGCQHETLEETSEGYECVDCDAILPPCSDCGDVAECAVTLAPGMGNEPYCEDDCPICNL